MKVSVRLFTALRELAGKSEETLEFDAEAVTLNEVLAKLVNRYSKNFREYLYNNEGKVREHLQLLVNGRNASLLDDLETKLKEGDHVAIVPPVGGG